MARAPEDFRHNVPAELVTIEVCPERAEALRDHPGTAGIGIELAARYLLLYPERCLSAVRYCLNRPGPRAPLEVLLSERAVDDIASAWFRWARGVDPARWVGAVIDAALIVDPFAPSPVFA